MSTQNSNGQSTEATEGQGPVGQGNYVVKKGECIEKIAYKHGFFWETIWNDPQNDELKRQRKDPNVLLSGDKLFIPEKREKTESGATEQRHRFRRKGVPARLILQFKEEGEPRKNVPYIINIDGTVIEGNTDSDGKINVPIPPDAEKAELTLGKDNKITYQISLADLDPYNNVRGLQSRLKNLGYNIGNVNGRLDEETRNALRDFQTKEDLPVTGQMDEQTCDKLKDVHGS